MSKKTEVLVKSNGLRNELKEIRKSIDKLTDAIIMAQTNKHYEKINNCYRCGYSHEDCECNRAFQ